MAAKSHFETVKSKRAIFYFIAILLFSPNALADLVPVFAYDYYASTELINPTTQEIDLSTLSMLARVSDPFRFNMADYIPLKNLPESDNGENIARRIFQHTMQNLFDSHKNEYSGAIAGAQKLNQNMKTSIGTDKNSVQMRFLPFETRAEMSYKGSLPVQSSLSYVGGQNELRFEMSRKFANRTLAYTHVSATDQQKDLVGIRWNF